MQMSIKKITQCALLLGFSLSSAFAHSTREAEDEPIEVASETPWELTPDEREELAASFAINEDEIDQLVLEELELRSLSYRQETYLDELQQLEKKIHLNIGIDDLDWGRYRELKLRQILGAPAEEGTAPFTSLECDRDGFYYPKGRTGGILSEPKIKTRDHETYNPWWPSCSDCIDDCFKSGVFHHCDSCLNDDDQDIDLENYPPGRSWSSGYTYRPSKPEMILYITLKDRDGNPESMPVYIN